MQRAYRLVVFDAHMLRCLAINDNDRFPDELAAFRIAFQGRLFRILVTDGILLQYQTEANRFPPLIQLLPTLNSLRRDGRAIYFDEYLLNCSRVQLTGLPQEHSEFILDAIAARASYCITNRREWLELSEQTESRYGLLIVSPSRFVELEG